MNNCRICGRELILEGAGIGPKCMAKVKRENLFFDKYEKGDVKPDPNIKHFTINSLEVVTTNKIKANGLMSVGIDPTLMGPNITSLFYRDSNGMKSNPVLEFYFSNLVKLGVIPADSVLSGTFSNDFFDGFDGAIAFYPHSNPDLDNDDLIFLTLYLVPDKDSKIHYAFTAREFGIIHKDKGEKNLFLLNSNYDGFDFKGETLFLKDADDFEKVSTLCRKLIEQNKKAKNKYDYSILHESTKTMQLNLDEMASRVFVRSFLREYAPGLSQKNTTNDVVLEFTPGKIKMAFARYIAKKKPNMSEDDKDIVKKSFEHQLIREIFSAKEIEILEDFIDMEEAEFRGDK